MNGGSWWWLFGIVAVGAAVLLLTIPSAKPLIPPYVDAGPDSRVDECASIRLAAEGFDPNGGPITFNWTAEGNRGYFDEVHALQPVYTAPEICGDSEDVVLTLTVTNERDLSASDTVMIRVCEAICPPPVAPCQPQVPAPSGVTTLPSYCPLTVPEECEEEVTAKQCPVVNRPPFVDAGKDVVANECVSIQLTCTASDPDGDPLMYYWSSAGGRGQFNNPRILHPTYITPALDSNESEDILLTLTVTDSHGASTSDSMVVRVNAVNRQPVVDAGENVTISECSSVQLTCTASDPDGGPLTYSWSAADGRGQFDNPCVLHPIYTAPVLVDCRTKEIVLTLTVTDSHGARASDSMVVYVKAVNHPPVVDAGGDVTINECSSIQLTCTASDPDGDLLTYYWTAKDDRGQFDNPHVLHPTYTALALDCETAQDIVLTLTVTDSCGASAADSLVVHVSALNRPPAADAGEDVTINEASSVQLTCSASDPDGDPLTYHWKAAGDRGQFDDPHILHPTYTTPALDSSETEDIVLTLTVTDTHGATASDSLVVHAHKLSPPPSCPVSPTPPCQSPPSTKSVNEGGCIQLHGEVSDPDSNLVRFWWTADKGSFSDATSLDPIYYAPMTGCCGGENVLITLTAMDSCGATGSDGLIMHVNDVNRPPVVDAGEDVTISECSSVQLTCTASDPDGDPLTYYWTAAGGRGHFGNPCVLHPVYTAPTNGCNETQDIVLTLTVTDSRGQCASDSMIVHVGSTNIAPKVKADP